MAVTELCAQPARSLPLGAACQLTADGRALSGGSGGVQFLRAVTWALPAHLLTVERPCLGHTCTTGKSLEVWKIGASHSKQGTGLPGFESFWFLFKTIGKHIFAVY